MGELIYRMNSEGEEIKTEKRDLSEVGVNNWKQEAPNRRK